MIGTVYCFKLLTSNSKYIYIGSTNNLYMRNHVHKQGFKNDKYALNFHQKMNEIGGEPIHEQIKYYKNITKENKYLLRLSEYEQIFKHASEGWEVLNTNKPMMIKQSIQLLDPIIEISKEEFEILNEEQTKEFLLKQKQNAKNWYQLNRDRHLKKVQEWKQKNLEQKQLYEERYYVKNHDKLNEKIICECGGKYTKLNKSNHEKTKKHKNYYETK